MSATEVEPRTDNQPDGDCPLIAGLKIEDLGVLPEVAMRINDMADRPSTTGNDVAQLILRDPTLTSKILRMINSAYYGLFQEIRSVPHAVAYLGIHQVRNLAVSGALIEAFRFEHGVVEPRRVWEHSLGCAIGAKRLGDLLPGLDGDGIYLGGLLHDVGRIVLLSKFPENYGEVVNTCERGLCTLRDAEQSRFGLSHAEAGFKLGQAWGFSEPVQAMIRYHHHPLDAGPMAAPAAVVGIANALCHAEDLRFGFEVDDDRHGEEKERAWEALAHVHPNLGSTSSETLEQVVIESIRNTKDLVADFI